jgi:hypothetical protein
VAIRRSYFAENRLDATACNTSGLIPAVLTNQAALSLQKLLTPCSATIVMRLNATYIYPMFWSVALSEAACQPFGRADGLLEAGRSKTFSLLDMLNSFLQKGTT